MRMHSLLVILLILAILPASFASSTQQSNKIFLSPFYLNSMSQNTWYNFTVNINPSDGIRSVKSAIMNFQVWSTPSVNFTILVNNKACNTPWYYISTTYSSAGQSLLTFDCSNMITAQGTYNVSLRPSLANTGSLQGWLDITYMNNPISISTGGTEYLPNEPARIFVRLLDGNSRPINSASCNATVYYPNNTKFLNNASLALLERGVYYNDFTTPNITGNYITIFDCITPSIPFFQNFSLVGTELTLDHPQDAFTFGFDNSNNVTINSARLEVSATGSLIGSIMTVNFNGRTLGTMTGTTPALGNYTLTQSDFYITDAQQLLLTRDGTGTNNPLWARLVVNYTWNDPSQLIRGQDEVHVTNVPGRVWDYNPRNLTYYPTVNATLANASAVVEQVWAWNGTVSNNLLDRFSIAVWNYTNRTLTAFNFLINLTQYSLDQILVPIGNNFTYTNSQISSVNTTLFNEMQSIQYNLQSVNDTVKGVNSSLSSQITTVYNHIGDVLNDISSLNGTVLSINQTTMNKLFAIQDEITSVNDTLKSMNITLPSTVWNYNDRTLTSFNFTVNINSTDILNDLALLQSGLVSVNNTVKDVNATLSSEISGVYNHVTDAINDIASMNDTMISINATTMWKLYRIQDEITSVNDTVKSLNFSTLTADQVWNFSNRTLTWYNTSGIAYDVWAYSNRSLTEFNFVVNANISTDLQAILNALVSVNDTVKATNATLSNQITDVYVHVSDVLVEIANLNDTMLAINQTTMYQLAQIQQGIYGINNTDLILELGQNLTSVNQTIIDAINALNTSSLTASDVWTFQNRTLTEFNFTVSVNATINATIDFTPVLNEIANMNNSMFAINSSTFGELQSIQGNIAIANNSIYSVNSSLSGQLSNVYNQIGVVIGDVASHNNTLISVNQTIMNKLYGIQNEITSVNDTVKSMNYSINNMMVNNTNTITGDIANLTLISANDVWTNTIRTLTTAVNVTAGNITNVETVGTVNNAEATFADVRYSGATEYNSGETGQVSYLFLNTISGNPEAVNNGTCNATIWYPNKTVWYNMTNLTYLSGSQGIYYMSIVPVAEGIYTTNAQCLEGPIRGFGSSTFHVAPWANKIYLIPSEINTSLNVTANVSDDIYYRMRDFIISWDTDSDATNRTCMTNDTLRVTDTYVMDINGNVTSFSKYSDYYCELGCDSSTLPASCTAGSVINIWFFLIMMVVALFMMFIVKSKIVNMIGAMVLILLGGYIIVAGIEFSAVLGFVGTASSFTLNNTVTYALGAIFIALGIFRIAVAWAKMQS